jgi:hypothetical protein
MPPVLNPKASKVDGLAFVGLSLARKTTDEKGVVVGHPDSPTHQTAFDLNQVIDRDYQYIFSTNDDGWLCGGGEPTTSYKLAAVDTAHVEIMRIGTYERQWGGLPRDEIIATLSSGKILIPEMSVVPTAVVANGDVPPELEIRFDMEKDDGNESDLPVNWQLRFLHNQLFRHFSFPSRFCPGAFHSTIVRKAEFRSDMAKADYFGQCFRTVQAWRKHGPQPLVAPGPLHPSIVRIRHNGTVAASASHALHEVRSSCNCYPLLDVVQDILSPLRGNKDDDDDDDVVDNAAAAANDTPLTSTATPTSSIGRSSKNKDKMVHDAGIYLFRDRKTITHYFEPNFFPPYNTPEKKMIIAQILAEQWDESTLSWQPSVDGVVVVAPPGGGSTNNNNTKVDATTAADADRPAAAAAIKVKATPPQVKVKRHADPMIKVADAIKKDATVIKKNTPVLAAAAASAAAASLVEQ